MNILQQEDLIKGTPDDLLVQEAQNPSGAVPQFLVISEIQRRQDMRQRFAAEEEQPQQTVADQIVSGVSPQQQDIAALPPQMPPQAPVGAMPPQMPPPQMPPQMMPPPQMPPEMMAAQMPPMASQPQQVMMAGGGPIPNAIIEDASKFSPESLYDVDPVQQSAMLNATNMGIPSVLPMAGGGVVRMQEGGYLAGKQGWIPDRYQDEGEGIGSLDYSQIGGDVLTAAEVAALAMMLAPEPTSSIAGGVLKAGTTAARWIPRGLGIAKKAIQGLPEGGLASLGRRIAGDKSLLNFGVDRFSDLGRQAISRLNLGRRSAGLGIVGLLEAARRRRLSERSETDVEANIEAMERLGMSPVQQEEKRSGGIIKMQSGSQVPISFSTARQLLSERGLLVPTWLTTGEGNLSQSQEKMISDISSAGLSSPADIDPRLLMVNPDPQVREQESLNKLLGDPAPRGLFGDPDPRVREQERLNRLFGMSQEDLNRFIPPLNLEAPPPPVVGSEEVIGVPDVPVLQTGAVTPGEVGIRDIPGLTTPDQGTELKTARERLTGLMGQEVEPYDPTELLLKSQERADQRSINQALIEFGAGIARGDAASGLKEAGTAVAGIRDRQELIQHELELARGEAQVQAQKDQIARDIAIAEADIGAIESDKDRQDELIGRKIQYEDLLLRARDSGNDTAIKQFTAALAQNTAVQHRYEFERTLSAELSEQEQLNYRAQLTTLNNTFDDLQLEIIRRNKITRADGTIPTWGEIQQELEAARIRIFGQIVSLQKQGTDWELPEELRNIGSGEIQIISSRP